MEIPTIISLVVYGVTILGVLLGFLFGLWKGLKKASLRILVFIVFLVLASLLSQTVTKALLGINITINGTTASISDQIINLIKANETILGFYESSSAFAQLVNVIPIALVNFVVFLVLVYIFGLIGYIGYLILAAILFRKRKKPYVVKNGKAEVVSDYKAEKKYRLLGGVIGAVQAFILIFVTLMPVTAIASTFSDLTNSTENNVAYAIESTEDKYTPTSRLLRENLPVQLIDAIDAYNSTLFAKVSHIGDLDQIFFDTLTTVKVDGQKITLRKEINNIANVYDNVDFLMNLDFQNINLDTLDYAKIEVALNALFESGLLKSILPDVLDYALEQAVSEQGLMGYQIPDNYKRYVQAVKLEFDNNKGIETIKSDVYAVFGIVKTLGESGILDQLKEEKINLENILTLVNKNDRIVVSNIVSNLLNSSSTKALLVELLNSGLEKLDDMDSEVDVPSIDKSQINWSLVKTEITSITNSLLDIYQNIDDNLENNDIKQIIEQPIKLFSIDTDKLTVSLSSILNNLQNSHLFVSGTQTKIYDSLIDMFENTEYSSYVDASVFKQDNSWASEFEYLNLALKNIKNSGIITILTSENIDIELILDKLATKDTETNQTYIRNIVKPLLDSKAFERAVTNAGFAYIDSLISNYQKELGEDVVLGKIQAQKLSQDNEKELVVAFFENLIVYAQDLSLQQLKDDAFKEIVSSNLSRLGSALDTIKASQLFGEYAEENETINKGIYENLIDALANNPDFNKFADFEVAKQADFSWNSELSLLQDAIDTLNNITINIDGEEKTIINAIKDGDDLTTIFENLSTDNQDIYNIVNPLAESRLMKKNLVTIINTLNAKLEQILNAEIDELSNDIDLNNEKQVIVDTLEIIVDLYPTIKNEFNDEILEQNHQAIGQLLNILMSSKVEEGIFSGTYDAFMEYIENSEHNEKVTYLLSEYENQNDIDWVEILDVAISAKNYSSGEINQDLKSKLSSLVGKVYADEDCAEIMGTLIDIANDTMMFDSSTEATDALDLLINSLQLLEQYNSSYQKVHKVITFTEKMTGLTEMENVKDITNFTQEKENLIALKNNLDNFEQTPSQLNIENTIESLSNSNFAMDIMTDNQITIEIEDEYKTIAVNYIEQNVNDSSVIESLYAIFNIEK